MHTEKSICAVVVTFNRKALLLNCLNALKAQTHPLTHIVVIDNASTDGTADFLGEHGWTNNDVFTLITLPENMGGAGGFHEGIKYAFEHGFDYIWLMDDDGVPANDCLARLFPFATENNYLGPLVLDIKQPNKFCFPMRLPSTLKRLDTLADLKALEIKEKIDGIVIPFNGILLPSKVVEKVGFPLKEYFIWGDDMEYTARMKKYGVEIASIVDAYFYHPKDESLGMPMFFNKLHFNDTPSKLKLYCMCRNAISNHKKYSGYLHVFAFIFKTLWFYSLTKPSFSKLSIAIRGIFHGIMGDFSHHKDYLK